VTGSRRGDDSHAEKPASPRSGSLGEIGCNLDLANERKHIRGKPVIEQDFRINLAVPGIGLGFVQDREEVIQHWRKAGTDA